MCIGYWIKYQIEETKESLAKKRSGVGGENLKGGKKFSNFQIFLTRFPPPLKKENHNFFLSTNFKNNNNYFKDLI